jgi:outer membrane receptor protein involved in Fe transport
LKETKVRHIFLGTAAIGALLVVDRAQAETAQRYRIDLPAEALSAALRDLAATTHSNIIAASRETGERRVPAIAGELTLAEALARLLDGTGLHAVRTENGFVIESDRTGAREEPAITVTGTRIAGAPVASSVISLSQQDMRDAGQTSLAQAILAIPQNFGGGQNPGIGLNVPLGSGSYIGAGSGLNLRGLGGDATLTLLDNQRLSYNATLQSIDIAAIPFGLVDHIEIVADGASALYGSDAVAGVANVVLRHDYEGLTTSARFGGSTDGGNQQQQYDVVAGHRWSNGGFILSYDFERDTAILASQRSYAAEQTPGLTLYPALEHHSVGLSGHQDLAPDVTFGLDALYNWRRSYSAYALDPTGMVFNDGGDVTNHDGSFALAPSLKGRLGAWHWTLQGSYGQDHATYLTNSYYLEQNIYASSGCYCNSAVSGELGAEGPLFQLPGGSAHLAFGGGIRSNRFDAFRTLGTAQDIVASQQDAYGYAEIALPLVSPALGLPALYSLNLTGALRYDNYPGIDDVVTPRLGAIYAPTADFEIKGSWGRSFRAPTLYEQYNSVSTVLYPASYLGGANYPASATALVVTGGNPDLKPERATTWSATLALHPRVLEGAHLDLSYFNVHYTNRIVTPIPLITEALNNPAYADLVNLTPSPAQTTALTSNSQSFINGVGGVYNPASVVAIVNDASLNVASQNIDGIDIAGRYGTKLGARQTLSATVSATWLESSQKLSTLQPEQQLAGIIFNPPHWRWRAGAVWATPVVTLSSYVTYTGGVEDTRSTPAVPVGSLTSWDLTGSYHFPVEHGVLHGVTLTVAAANVLNAKPAQIAGQVYEAPYDSTNYSPFGRMLSLTVAKSW